MYKVDIHTYSDTDVGTKANVSYHTENMYKIDIHVLFIS